MMIIVRLVTGTSKFSVSLTNSFFYNLFYNENCKISSEILKHYCSLFIFELKVLSNFRIQIKCPISLSGWDIENSERYFPFIF